MADPTDTTTAAEESPVRTRRLPLGIPGLARMRLDGFVRSGRVIAPAGAALIVLAVSYAGGSAPAGESYGYSAAALFPVMAITTQMLLNTEPDAQRRLSMVAVGGPVREMLAGALAATVAMLAVIGLGLVAPWPFGGVSGADVAAGVAVGVWANLLLLPPALALGALASRAAVSSTAIGLAILATGSVFGYVAGVRGSVIWWLGPPVLRTARSTVGGLDAVAMFGHTLHALVWSAVLGALYVRLRRRNV